MVIHTSVLNLLLSLDNLLTGYKQLSYEQFNRNLSICVLLAKIDLCSIKGSIKIWQLITFKQKIESCETKDLFMF